MLEANKYRYEFWSYYSENIPYGLGKFKIKAVAKKGLRDGLSADSIISELMKESDLSLVNQQLGKEKTLKVLSDLINEAIEEELAYTQAS